jgi:type VI secretion system protein ImpF
MGELTPQERLQPALLDRLTDDEPGTRQEARERRVMSKSRLRQAVLRDLAWLFNATRMETAGELARMPHVRRSVVNSACQPSRTGLSLDRISNGRSTVDLDFEPRILPESLEVKALVELSELDHHNVIGIEIHGQLWAQPVPLELLIRTEFDLETGKVHISDLAPSRVS